MKISVNHGKAGKIQKDDILTDDENPKYGFYWWFWLPTIRTNHGSISEQEILDINLHWLCYWYSITIYPN